MLFPIAVALLMQCGTPPAYVPCPLTPPPPPIRTPRPATPPRVVVPTHPLPVSSQRPHAVFVGGRGPASIPEYGDWPHWTLDVALPDVRPSGDWSEDRRENIRIMLNELRVCAPSEPCPLIILFQEWAKDGNAMSSGPLVKHFRVAMPAADLEVIVYQWDGGFHMWTLRNGQWVPFGEVYPSFSTGLRLTWALTYLCLEK